MNYQDYMTHQQFLKLEDKEFQRYLFIAHKISHVENEIFKIDNEEKLGFYSKANMLKMNGSGVIYPCKKLTSYIVYYKETKKVAISCPRSSELFRHFIKTFFISEKFGIFIPNLTKVLTKLIIQRKVRTLRDLMNYHRSYTFKNKSLTDREIIACTYFNCFYLIGCKNLEQLDKEKNFILQNKVPPHIVYVPRVKATLDIGDIDSYDRALEEYKNWENEQHSKVKSLSASSKEQ